MSERLFSASALFTLGVFWDIFGLGSTGKKPTGHELVVGAAGRIDYTCYRPSKSYPMNKMVRLLVIGLGILFAAGVWLYAPFSPVPKTADNPSETNNQNMDGGMGTDSAFSLSIDALRAGEYPGSDIVIEQTLTPGGNYQRYIASYRSEGLKIYALLTVPDGEKPGSGWPVIVFNHGYIAPAEYKTTERYIAYMDAFSRNGYILFRPDYRGNGNSEGLPSGAYGSNGYTIDVLNAVASLKKYPQANPDRIGMWGHSMGGFITLRAMVVRPDIKAGVIWGGVVGSYADLVNNWRRRSSATVPAIPSGARRWRQALIDEHGTPEQNPQFWNSLSANSYLADISGPLELHHGAADTSVPLSFSETLRDQMLAAGKTVELFTYAGDDHNLSNNLSVALSRSVAFFDTYLKVPAETTAGK